MEEKERYYSVIDCNEDFVIRDCDSGRTCKSLFEVKTLLNYQDREINRLTKMLYTTTKHADKLNEENNKLNKENQKLKQQLHDLPKKIVEEITNELSNNTSLYFEMRESTSAHCPNKEYEWFNYVRFRNYINAILEKFGEKDE